MYQRTAMCLRPGPAHSPYSRIRSRKRCIPSKSHHKPAKPDCKKKERGLTVTAVHSVSHDSGIRGYLVSSPRFEGDRSGRDAGTSAGGNVYVFQVSDSTLSFPCGEQGCIWTHCHQRYARFMGWWGGVQDVKHNGSKCMVGEFRFRGAEVYFANPR